MTAGNSPSVSDGHPGRTAVATSVTAYQSPEPRSASRAWLVVVGRVGRVGRFGLVGAGVVPERLPVRRLPPR